MSMTYLVKSVLFLTNRQIIANASISMVANPNLSNLPNPISNPMMGSSSGIRANKRLLTIMRHTTTVINTLSQCSIMKDLDEFVICPLQ